jgi:AntA/AntB antirepressor
VGAIAKYGFVQGVDFILHKIMKVQIEGNREVNREITDYYITIDMAKELSMVENGETVSLKEIEEVLPVRVWVQSLGYYFFSKAFSIARAGGCLNKGQSRFGQWVYTNKSHHAGFSGIYSFNTLPRFSIPIKPFTA